MRVFRNVFLNFYPIKNWSIEREVNLRESFWRKCLINNHRFISTRLMSIGICLKRIYKNKMIKRLELVSIIRISNWEVKKILN